MGRLARAWRKRSHRARRWEPSGGAGGSAREMPQCPSLSTVRLWNSLLLRPCSRTGDLGETDDRNELPVQPGYGLSLWSRVATATSTLTVSMSKAWASNIVAYSGERTSSGFLPLVWGNCIIYNRHMACRYTTRRGVTPYARFEGVPHRKGA